MEDMGTDAASYVGALSEGTVTRAGTAVSKSNYSHIKGSDGGFEPGAELLTTPYVIV